MLRGLITLLMFFLAGEFISALFAWPVPGSVLGMLLLFVVLVVRGAISEPLRQSSQNLLPYLPLFIVPASVGIVNHMDLLKDDGLLIMFAMVISLLAGLPLAGWVMQWFMTRTMNRRKQSLHSGDS